MNNNLWVCHARSHEKVSQMVGDNMAYDYLWLFAMFTFFTMWQGEVFTGSACKTWCKGFAVECNNARRAIVSIYPIHLTGPVKVCEGYANTLKIRGWDVWLDVVFLFRLVACHHLSSSFTHDKNLKNFF